MDSMILGRYIPGDSIVHRLDPRSKIACYDATDFNRFFGLIIP